ncbi:MAG: hypothetical protein AABY16_01565 [Nanoarchaeota archaeon]
MKELTDFDAKKIPMKMIGRADFREIVQHNEMLRRRRIFIFLDFLAVISIIIGFLLYKLNYYTESYFAFGIALLIILYFVFRKINNKKKRDSFIKNRRFRNGQRGRRFRRRR